MPITISCPACGAMKEIPEDSSSGTRRWCRFCGTVMEVHSLQPLEVVKIPRCAEDFGI